MSPFLFVLFIGLIIRLLLVGNTGFIADISFWKSWSIAAVDHGIVWTTHNTNINYPPGFIYVLWLMGKLYSIFGDPHNFNTFWKENNFGFLLASKSIAIVSDTIIAYLIYWFTSQKEKLKQLGSTLILKGVTESARSSQKRGPLAGDFGAAERQDPQIINNLPLLLSSVFFLNPIVILDSALWGQVESFGLLFTISAILLLFYKRPLIATSLFTIGFLMKLQNIIFIPIFFLFIFRYYDLKTLIKTLAVATITFFAVNLPFILQNEMKQVLYLMTVNSDYFPWLSLNANNLWWIVANASGMQISDRITVLGILNAKTVGLILFSAFYLLFSFLVLIRPIPRNFILALLMAIFAFFLFTTQSHERYSYPVIVLLLFLYPFLSLRRSEKYFWIIYALLTITIFFNMHMGLVYNYPQNGFALLTRITTLPATILNSYALIILFLLLLPYVFSQISILFFVLCSLFFAFSLFALNFSYLFKGQVSLTNYKPIITKQDFGILQVNRAVNSASGWKSWSRLSNNYFYYRKGFGTHANSNLVFDIDKKFNKFTTDVGIDTEADTTASVIFKIFADGKELYKSKKMGRFDYPEHVELEISNVKHIGLVVEDAGDGINNDHADWLNPVLYK